MSGTIRRHAALAFSLALLVTGCSGSQTTSPAPIASGGAACAPQPSVPDDLEGWSGQTAPTDLVPVQITGAMACGRNRILFTFRDADERPAAAPTRRATFSYFQLGRDRDTAFATVEGTFVWAIEDTVGIYVTNVDFPESGRYGVEIDTAVGSGPAQLIRLTFDVRPSTAVVKVGDKAPASRTPTLAEVGGDPRRLSTDPSPEPRLYETSVDAALADRKPFVLVFATPKFCASAQCGPTLERIKPFVARYPAVTFINVEPYKLKLVDGRLEADTDAAGQLQVAPTTEEWKLANEPSVYVVDGSGTVTANFELIFSDEELTTALDALK